MGYITSSLGTTRATQGADKEPQGTQKGPHVTNTETGIQLQDHPFCDLVAPPLPVWFLPFLWLLSVASSLHVAPLCGGGPFSSCGPPNHLVSPLPPCPLKIPKLPRVPCVPFRDHYVAPFPGMRIYVL